MTTPKLSDQERFEKYWTPDPRCLEDSDYRKHHNLGKLNARKAYLAGLRDERERSGEIIGKLVEALDKVSWGYDWPGSWCSMVAEDALESLKDELKAYEAKDEK